MLYKKYGKLILPYQNVDKVPDRNVRREDGNRQQKPYVAELFSSKGTDLPGAAIDAHGVRITLWGAGLAAGMTEGCQRMRFALTQRDL